MMKMPKVAYDLLQLFHKVGVLEVLGYVVIKTSNHLVDGLLPRLFVVFVLLQRAVKLTQCCLTDAAKVLRNLYGE